MVSLDDFTQDLKEFGNKAWEGTKKNFVFPALFATSLIGFSGCQNQDLQYNENAERVAEDFKDFLESKEGGYRFNEDNKDGVSLSVDASLREGDIVFKSKISLHGKYDIYLSYIDVQGNGFNGSGSSWYNLSSNSDTYRFESPSVKMLGKRSHMDTDSYKNVQEDYVTLMKVTMSNADYSSYNTGLDDLSLD
ncbi:MAG: hypothetical protein ABEI74_01885 [Candidatus Pacearchaeota archaeon]